jgi:acyl-CoA synthetase (AMP-forming)/AMP-acid ligase II
MVPGEVLQLGELPLNKNGKIDRALLRERRQSGAYKEAR